MTLLPSPLRAGARLALALAAVGMSGVAAVATPDPAGAKRDRLAPVEALRVPVEVEPPDLEAAVKGTVESLPSQLGETPALAPAAAPTQEQLAPIPAAPAVPQTPAADPSLSAPSERRVPTRARTGPDPGHGSTRRNGGRPGARSPKLSPAGPAAEAWRPAARSTEEKPRPATEQSIRDEDGGGSSVARTVEEIVEVVPESVGIALAGLLAMSLVLAGASLLSTARARRLEGQRRDLLSEVGLLQTALLPPVPAQLGALHTSVAYRPADGPGAGGDFYDALPLPGGRAAFILGDVSGHGRAALGRTAFLRYTLRAYLEAGLEPRVALQVAGRVIDEHLDGDFATAVLAVHDPATASLTFACAGHPAPIVVGPSSFEPVLPGSSPPLGIGLRTGLRQTTIPLAPGSVACLFTDGLTEARTEKGILGRPRLGDILTELGREVDAAQLLEHLAAEARLVTDDMAACLLSPLSEATAGGFRVEQLELAEGELGGNVARRFLEACGVDGESAARTELETGEISRRFGGAVLTVSYGTGAPLVEVTPRNVESIEAASWRVSATG